MDTRRKTKKNKKTKSKRGLKLVLIQTNKSISGAEEKAKITKSGKEKWTARKFYKTRSDIVGGPRRRRKNDGYSEAQQTVKTYRETQQTTQSPTTPPQSEVKTTRPPTVPPQSEVKDTRQLITSSLKKKSFFPKITFSDNTTANHTPQTNKREK